MRRGGGGCTGRRDRRALRRTLRLILAPGFGMLAIVPVQAYCEARANGPTAHGFGAFLLSYVQLGRWPADAFTGAEYGLSTLPRGSP